MVAPGGARVAWATVADAPRRAVARALLRDLLAPDFGDVHFEQECPACGSRNHGPLHAIAAGGRATPLVGVSYAGTVAVAAVGPVGAVEFGIDAELDSPRTRAAIAEALSDLPDPSIREWTALEAIAKARGTGLRCDWQHPDAAGFDVTHLPLPALQRAQDPPVEGPPPQLIVAIATRLT